MTTPTHRPITATPREPTTMTPTRRISRLATAAVLCAAALAAPAAPAFAGNGVSSTYCPNFRGCVGQTDYGKIVELFKQPVDHLSVTQRDAICKTIKRAPHCTLTNADILNALLTLAAKYSEAERSRYARG